MDDGNLAQSALRTYHGQLPHRDFVEIYTGLLSYIHAFGFRVFGVNLAAMRYMQYVFFLPFLAAVFYIGLQLASPWGATLLMMLATAWSVPTFPVPMPSWYNLFFAVFVLAALFRFLETKRRYWLFASGVLAGLSFLIKVIGLYAIAAVVLFLVFRAQSCTEEQSAPAASPAKFGVLVSLCLLMLPAGILGLLRHHLGLSEIVCFLFPTALLVFFLMLRELPLPGLATSGSNPQILIRDLAAFLTGCLIPIVLFILPYLASGSLHAFWGDVFVGGANAAESLATVRPPALDRAWISLLVVALIFVATFWKHRMLPAIGILATVLLATLLFVRDLNVVALEWYSAAMLTPIVLLAGVALLGFQPRMADDLMPLRQQQIFLTLAMLAMCSLVQFPFSVPIYFCYFAPLAGIALFALVSSRKSSASPMILAVVAVYYVMFAVLQVAPRAIYRNPAVFLSAPSHLPQVLNLERAGGLHYFIPEMYTALADVIRTHASHGKVVATPECPEVYFLNGLENPGRNDNYSSEEEIVSGLQRGEISVVVINRFSRFSQSTVTSELLGTVQSHLQNAVDIGKYRVFYGERAR